MIEIAGMSLLVTNKCNAACRHCGLSAGPDKGSVISAAQAEACLEGLRRQKNALLVSYTGGEPFLYYQLLLEIISTAVGFGFYGEVVTNSFWADDCSKTRKILQNLRRCGVINFVTSLDDFHAEFINPEYVKNAALIACELGFNVTVKVMQATEASEVKYTYEYVCDFLDAGRNKIKIFRQYPVFTGRADHQTISEESRANQMVFEESRAKRRQEDLPKRQRPPEGPSEDKATGRCTTVIRFPAINPGGEVYPCCGFGENLRLLGNMNVKPLHAIFEDMQNNLFLNLLAYQGPLQLLNEARRYLIKPPRENFGNICEVCNYICGDAEVARAVGSFLADRYFLKTKRGKMGTELELMKDGVFLS